MDVDSKGKTRIDPDVESVLKKNVKEILYRLICGQHEEAQLVCDVFLKDIRIKKALLKYSDASVAIADKDDPEQSYIKGVVDGMRLFWALASMHEEDPEN